MIVVDEYLAARIAFGAWPDDLPDDDDIALPASRHWRLLQRIHNPAGGQLSALIAQLTEDELMTIRYPHPEVLQILDTRPLLDDAAVISARFNVGGWLVCETLAAGVVNRQELFFGTERNVGGKLASTADELGVQIHVLD